MTEQSDFWQSDFGDDYIQRNQSQQLLASNLYLFGQILGNCHRVPESFLELGANIGMNYKAISLLSPDCDFFGVEVNEKAFAELMSNGARGACSTIEDFNPADKFEFVFTKGVLIHLNPDSLPETYRKMASSSQKYVMICEYFNPTPMAISYRGHENKLFKRDFGGEFLQENKDFIQVAEGFTSVRSPFPQDNLNWSLFSRVQND
jgi:pseudaminic acid biosynthesis-associated methylase